MGQPCEFQVLLALNAFKSRLTPRQCSDLTHIFIGMHRNAPLSPTCIEEGATCQGTPFLWFLCTFHLWLL
jgi:hypothetical protein